MSDDAQAADPADLEARLRVLDALPVDEHVAIYDGLHRELRDQLAGTPDGLDASDGATASEHSDSQNVLDVSDAAGPPVAPAPWGTAAASGPAGDPGAPASVP